MSQSKKVHLEERPMDDITKKLQKLVAQRHQEKVVYDHNEHNPYARRLKSTSFDSYYSGGSAQE